MKGVSVKIEENSRKYRFCYMLKCSIVLFVMLVLTQNASLKRTSIGKSYAPQPSIERS